MNMRSTELITALRQAEVILKRGGPECDGFCRQISGLLDRVAHERFQLAILGQFKRGKSTFINALLGAPILPVGVLPLTAVAVFISWSADPFVRITFNDRTREPDELRSGDPQRLQDFLSCFVAEDRNPQNYLAVGRVELGIPAPLLSTGIILIDTPGVGSSYEHNTQAAIDILPECDAAMFVMSGDPPITEIELAYLEQIKRRIKRVFFVMNKFDYLGAGEREIVINFARKVLGEHGLIDSPDLIFGVSARDALLAKQSGDKLALAQTGIVPIEEFLTNDLARQKSDLLMHSIRRKADDVLADAIGASQLRIKALVLPIEELESRTKTFERALEGIQDQHLAIKDLITGDKRRLRETLEQDIAELRSEAKAAIMPVINSALSTSSPDKWQQQVSKSVAQVFNSLFDSARERLRRKVATNLFAAIGRHRNHFGALITSTQAAAAEIFEVALSKPEEDVPFELGEDPYWVTETINTSLLPDPGRLLDRLVPLGVRRSRVRARFTRDVDELILRNAENLRWALLRGIEETTLRATDHFETRLSGAIAAIRRVIEATLSKRQNRSFDSAGEIGRTQTMVSELTRTHGALGSAPPDLSISS